jgi:hypothetical protein
MQKNVSPVVAIIVILILVAVIAFAWMRLTEPEKPAAGPASQGAVRGRPARAESGRGERGRPGERRGGRAGRGEADATAPGS